MIKSNLIYFNNINNFFNINFSIDIKIENKRFNLLIVNYKENKLIFHCKIPLKLLIEIIKAKKLKIKLV